MRELEFQSHQKEKMLEFISKTKYIFKHSLSINRAQMNVIEINQNTL